MDVVNARFLEVCEEGASVFGVTPRVRLKAISFEMFGAVIAENSCPQRSRPFVWCRITRSKNCSFSTVDCPKAE